MDISDLTARLGGPNQTPEVFGADYIPEFCRVLDRYVPTARSVLEWGSGFTSQVLVAYGQLKWECELFMSVDDKKDYQDAVFAEGFRHPFVRPIIIDRVGPCVNQDDPELNYSSYPLTSGKLFDLILIDGRRRMECAFTASILCHSETIVILHDYRRARYRSILALYESLEDGPQFRVMRLRPEVLAAIRPGAESVRNAFRQAPS